MNWVEVYLGLGSNLGDRDLNLLRAMNRLDQALGKHPERISRIVETPSWGFDGPPFLNMCVLYRIPAQGEPEQQALSILRSIKEIEADMGRIPEPMYDASGHRIYHDRIIDIDILLFGTEKIQTPELTVPHPLIGQRDFVKNPLLEISKPDVRDSFNELFS